MFGRESRSRVSIFKRRDPNYPQYLINYCTFTPIGEVFFDSIDPECLIIGDEQLYESIPEPHLNGFGWAVEGIDELDKTLVANGFRSTDLSRHPADPRVCPVASFSTSKLFFTLPEDTGLRYEFYPRTCIQWYDLCPKGHLT